MKVSGAKCHVSGVARQVPRLKCQVPGVRCRAHHPEGMFENSPGFQPWVSDQLPLSPGGTAELTTIHPSLRDLGCMTRQPNVETLGSSRVFLRNKGSLRQHARAFSLLEIIAVL